MAKYTKDLFWTRNLDSERWKMELFELVLLCVLCVINASTLLVITIADEIFSFFFFCFAAHFLHSVITHLHQSVTHIAKSLNLSGFIFQSYISISSHTHKIYPTIQFHCFVGISIFVLELVSVNCNNTVFTSLNLYKLKVWGIFQYILGFYLHLKSNIVQMSLLSWVFLIRGSCCCCFTFIFIWCRKKEEEIEVKAGINVPKTSI